jgi:hypothetical protein
MKKLMEAEGPGLYWLVAADYERTRAEFEYLVQDFTALGLMVRASKRVDPGYIDLADGTRIETKSARDPRTLAMKAPDGVVGCEASQLDFETYQRLNTRVGPGRAWMLLVGTMEGSLGWYPSLAESWKAGRGEAQSFSMPTTENLAKYPGGEEDPEIARIRQESSDDWYMERMLGIACPPRGMVFTGFRSELHVKDVEWEEGHPVYVWIDPGYRPSAYCVHAVQIFGEQVRVFDELYEHDKTTEDIVDMVSSSPGRPWWKDVVGGTRDVAGYAHQAMAAPAEVWLARAGVHLKAERIQIADGIERLKAFMKPDSLNAEPKIVWSPRCKGVLSELGHCLNPITGLQQVYSWDTDREGNIVGQVPRPRFDHGVKADWYGLVSHFGYSHVNRQKEIPVRQWVSPSRQRIGRTWERIRR